MDERRPMTVEEQGMSIMAAICAVAVAVVVGGF